MTLDGTLGFKVQAHLKLSPPPLGKITLALSVKLWTLRSILTLSIEVWTLRSTLTSSLKVWTLNLKAPKLSDPFSESEAC